MASEPKSKRLATNFAVYLAVTLCTVVGLTNFWLYSASKQHIQESLELQADTKLTSLSSMSSFYISSFEHDLVVEMGSKVIAESNVLFISVEDELGDSIFRDGQPGLKNSKQFERQILGNDEVLGLITIDLDTATQQEEIQNIRLISLLSFLFSVAFLGGLLFMFFRSQVVSQVEMAEKEKELMQEEHEFITAVIDTSNSLVVVLDTSGKVVMLNKSCDEFMHRPHEEAIGGQIWDYFNITYKDSDLRDEINRVVSDVNVVSFPMESMFHSEWESLCCGSEGEERFIEWGFTRLADRQGNTKYLIGTGQDITQRHLEQQHLTHLAHHDTLTSLPNRTLFEDRLNQATKRARRYDESFGMLYIDLDKFKPINDTYGHDAGDHVLIEVSSRMRKTLRDSDTVARLGGDEFAAILPNIGGIDNACVVATKLLEALTIPIEFNDLELQVGASIGVVVFPEDASNLDVLKRHADRAMYLAKESGRNTYRTFAQVNSLEHTAS